MRNLLVILLLVTTACGGEEHWGEAAQSQAAITDGEVDTGHPAVGVLEMDVPCTDSPGQMCVGRCTATLIGQRTLLTAAHCLEDITAVSAKLNGVDYEAASWAMHPQYDEVPMPADSPYPAFVTHLPFDVGVVILRQAPPLTPHRVAAAPPTIGVRVTLVGYGMTHLDEAYVANAVKRKAINTIVNLGSHESYIEGTGSGTGNICPGDSGGPSFAQVGQIEVLYGVASWIHGDGCGILGTHARVDNAIPWILEASNNDAFIYDGSDSAPPTGETPPPVASDTTPPFVQILNPIPNATIATLVDVSIQVQDDGEVASVLLRVDGVEVVRMQQAPFAFQVPLTPGAHLIEAVAHDAAGNQGQASVNVMASSAAPSMGGKSTMIQGGCSVGASSAGAGVPLWLVGLLLLARRRR